MTISAKLVMQLRERTGAGMMECKKFLTASNGDIELAINEMRKAGQAKVDKLTSKIAAEGVITISCADQCQEAVMVEINCQTDFVAKDENFINFATLVADSALKNSAENANALMNSDQELEQQRQVLITKVGENVQIRRLARVTTTGTVGAYCHSNKRIGVLVSLKSSNDKAADLQGLAKDLAMHIAASRPLVIYREQVSQELINAEREIFTARAQESGKPQEVIEKMIEGQLDKYLNEVSLMGQPFIKDTSVKIHQLLSQHNVEIENFVCFQVGEGIEKKEDNFVAEVMAQVRGNE